MSAKAPSTLPFPLFLFLPLRIGSDQTCGNYRRCPRAEVKGRQGGVGEDGVDVTVERAKARTDLQSLI